MVNKEKELNDRRLFLHLLSALQKDGRLVDFFSEDLSLYEDSQIGVAVRNIHESCKKVLDKYLEPVAVIDKAEGDEITIPENFDPGAIKLTGNVTGEPPFRGILRHKGWQAKKIDMPTLPRWRSCQMPLLNHKFKKGLVKARCQMPLLNHKFKKGLVKARVDCIQLPALADGTIRYSGIYRHFRMMPKS